MLRAPNQSRTRKTTRTRTIRLRHRGGDSGQSEHSGPSGPVRARGRLIAWSYRVLRFEASQ
jgi:hypothetical protein